MGFCYLPLERIKMGQDGLLLFTPDKAKLTVNSKKETNGRVKIAQESKWAKNQDGLVSFTP